MSFLSRTFSEIKKYPSAVFGMALVSILVILAILALVLIPYDEAIRLWQGSDNVWAENPKSAPPKWINLFRSKKLPETITISTKDHPESIEVIDYGEGFSEFRIVQEFEFNYDDFPSELNVFLEAEYPSAAPHAYARWITPDGREIELGEFAVDRTMMYRLSQDAAVRRAVGGRSPEVGLFADPTVEGDPVPLKGTYQFVLEGFFFEEGTKVDSKFVSYGKVHGLAGTDHRRRDITVALLWGAPVALAFGLVAAVVTSVITMALAAAAVWFGGWVDALIRRITEVNMMLPMLPILMMIGLYVSRSIWVMLGAVLLLSIFGGGILSYRSMFLQVKESGYIEAAKAYGAGSFRIIFRYMVPRIIPVLIPGFVINVPAFVFLEANLAMLGLGDPVLPTWGKLLNDANQVGALYLGQYYLVLEPAVLLALTGLGFALVGFALDRIFNPRLRGL